MLMSLIAVLVVAALGLLLGQAAALRGVLGIGIPYLGGAIFLAGICWRVLAWANVPVPFRIPTTCGQQKSFAWLPPAKIENPAGTGATVLRMALEILLFRSLFRNNQAQMDGQRLVIGENKFLWLGSLAFHWSLAVVLLRHLRLLLEPVPGCVLLLQQLDGFFQVGAPEWYFSDIFLVLALAYLLWRRLAEPAVRYMSLFSDYFALFLLLAIAVTGILMRYVAKTDTAAVKQLALGLATFSPAVPANLEGIFFAHLLLVSLLAAYFPFSKLVHLGGAFLSPTRNLANTSRVKRHLNPWNYPVKTHTYAEWEAEFRDKIIAAGLPLSAAAGATAAPAGNTREPEGV
jgi:nitrate reductase gamma subunit